LPKQLDEVQKKYSYFENEIIFEKRRKKSRFKSAHRTSLNANYFAAPLQKRIKQPMPIAPNNTFYKFMKQPLPSPLQVSL